MQASTIIPMYLTRHVFMQFITRRPFGIHSPFLFAFAENCIFNRETYSDFERLEHFRRQLLNDHTELMITDFGRGVRFGKKRQGNELLQYRRTVASIARGSLQNPSMCRFLYRTAKYLAPKNIMELGTSLGITTSFLARAAPNARVFTLEGCQQTSARAERLFRESDIKNIELVTGPFSQTLEASLQDIGLVDMVYIDGDHSYEGVLRNFSVISKHIHAGSVLILDDIRWSKGMKKAWLEIANHPQASLAVDMFRIGLIFFNPGLSKQIVPVAF